MAATLALSYAPPSIRQFAQQWCQQDPNPTSAAYVQSLLDDDKNRNNTNEAELHRLFPMNPRERITFGTSGLRGPFQPGPLGMNDLVVVQTAQGLARYLEKQQQQQQQQSQQHSQATLLRVVIGYDHRALPPSSPYALSSRQFALLTALVFLHAGWKKDDVIVLDGFLPTPLVPFGCQEWDAPLGIMITASHNPAQDAGYKIYYRACQILSPRDVDIQRCIEQNLEPWTDYKRLVEEIQQQPLPPDHLGSHCYGFSDPQQTNQLVDCYFSALTNSGLFTGQYAKYLAREQTLPKQPPLPLLVYTAMHGVGFALAQRVCQVLQLPLLCSVPQQEQPDPSFPTVSFPNPEERHALDLAKVYGLQQLQMRQQDFDTSPQLRNVIILANDPDADRLAVAEYDAQDQTWTTLTGDQIGILLGHWLWTQIGKSSDKPVAMCQSLVSSRMLAEIGQVEGFRVDETLTGFKWIGTQAKQLHQQGHHVLLAYEESIGYCCGNVVFDKDGISALAVFAELIVHVYGGGHQEVMQDEEVPPTPSLMRHMQTLYDKYGEFVSYNGYYRFKDPGVVNVILDKMRNYGGYDLKKVGEYEVASIRDLGVPGYDSTTSDHRPLLATSKSSPMVTLRFTNGCVAQFRASGTEPKFKYYIEMKGEPGVARHVVEERLTAMAETILEVLLEPARHGLEAPSEK